MAAGGLRPGVRLGTSPAARTTQVTQGQLDREQSFRDRHTGIREGLGSPQFSTGLDDEHHAPVTPFSQLPKGDQRRIQRHARSLGLTAGVVRANLHDLLDRANERSSSLETNSPGSTRAGMVVSGSPGSTSTATAPTALGHHWYLNEHRRIRGAAQEVGVPQSHLTAATAALSPTVPWEAGGKHVNLNLASKTARLLKDDPTVDITRAHAEHLTADQQDNPSSYAGRNPVNWHSLVGTHRVSDLPSHVVATLGSFSGRGGTFKKKNADGSVTEKPDKTFRGAGLEPMHELGFLAQARNRQNVTKALDVLRGNTTAGEALSPIGSPKPRTFNDNLASPYASPGRATIDRWAIRGMSGTDNTNDSGVINKMTVPKGRKTDPEPQASEEGQHHGMYLYLQHHMAHVARQRGLHAQEAQAVAWTQIKGEHEGFSQFGGALPHEKDFAKQRETMPATHVPAAGPGPLSEGAEWMNRRVGDPSRRMPGDRPSMTPEDMGDAQRETSERTAAAIGRNSRKKDRREDAPNRLAAQRERDRAMFPHLYGGRRARAQPPPVFPWNMKGMAHMAVSAKVVRRVSER